MDVVGGYSPLAVTIVVSSLVVVVGGCHCCHWSSRLVAVIVVVVATVVVVTVVVGWSVVVVSHHGQSSWSVVMVGHGHDCDRHAMCHGAAATAATGAVAFAIVAAPGVVLEVDAVVHCCLHAEESQPGWTHQDTEGWGDVRTH